MSCKLDKVLGVINDVAGGIKNPAALAEIGKLKNALTQFAVSMETKKKEVDIDRIIGKKVDDEVKETPLSSIGSKTKLTTGLAKELQGCNK